MRALASVVIPSYNQARYLAETITSVLAQTYAPVEIVVVNDGSPDTTELEKAIAPFRDRITYVRQENRGLAGARNAGLERIAGEYVVFLDSDDRLLPNAIADCVAALEARPECALVWGRRRNIDADGAPALAQPGLMEQPPCYAELLQTNIIGPPVGVMFRRSAVAAVGGFSPHAKAAEDYDLYLRLAQHHEIHRLDALVAEYRLHDASMSRNFDGMRRGLLAALDAQAASVRHDARLRRALDMGRQDVWERYDWEPRLGQLSDHARQGRWVQAALCATALLTRHPRRFMPVMAGRVRRLLPLSGN